MKWQDVIRKFHSDLNLSDLESFEVEIGATLPKDYRDFLIRFNGGKILFDSEFPISEPPYSAYLFSLWPLSDPSPGLGIKESRFVDTGEPFFNPGVLRIGDDCGTGFWFIGMLGALRGKLFYAYKEDYWSATICDECAAGHKQPEGYGFVCDRFDELPPLIYKHRDPD
jgi:hypothetical protein